MQNKNAMSICHVVDVSITLNQTVHSKTIEVETIIAIQPRMGTNGCMIDVLKDDVHTRFYCNESVTDILTSIRREQR